MNALVTRVRLETTQAPEFIDITDHVVAHVKDSGVRDGLVCIFSKHTTAAVVINENKARQKKLERDCEFDSDQASKCLGDTQQMSCTDWDNGTLEEVCNPVWQCD